MQERELRAWLLSGGESTGSTDGSVGSALDELAAEVETEHGVPVEVVRVRDCSAAGLQPLLLAAREAIVNAVRHSGAPSVSVYLEVEPQRVSIFVRDRGRGFAADAVAPDRRGISGSIVDRLARAGGEAQVRSTPGEGTEVEMSLPRVEAADDEAKIPSQAQIPEVRTEDGARSVDGAPEGRGRMGREAQIPEARSVDEPRARDRGPEGRSRMGEVSS
jgi:hypothetical protein